MDSAWATYRRLNNLTGWLMFLISAVVYMMTAEPTVSFWDCGEFILSAYGLQVGHPPGAPLFLMIGRIATLFAGGDASNVALMINLLSALCSAFTILFLFWTVTHLVRRVFTRTSPLDSRQIPAILASGIIGALTYTFSDTFWFSAVEGELYSMSSLMLGLVFWAMLKWEEEADEPSSGRWIILIAFIMGLGLGVHRLNLLVIPVLVLVFYFRKYEVSLSGFLKSLVLALLILGIMVFILIPGVPKVAGWFELLFVNGFGLPYNTGLLIFLAALIAALVAGIRYSVRKERVILNYVITCLTVIMIGYSSYAMIVIRSSARPPMNQNNPSDIFSLAYYINMQQYGSSPKFHGPYYSAPAEDVKDVLAGYNKVNGKYKPYYRPDYIYNDKFTTIFPRMYSPEDHHKSSYEYWGKVNGRRYTLTSASGKETIICPTFGENLRFFFRYQTGFMYLRYFMWNFAGRQNDIQGNGNVLHGNWISGVKFIDEMRLGDQDNLPADLRENPARNTYFFLPFLIGIMGMIWQFRRDRNGFILVLAFFIMTGFAIILYLNQYPNQPRERDYAYAGSFYAFAAWAGMGFMYFYELLRRVTGHKGAVIIPFIILLAASPVLLATQNWDDHDRSDRYTARDIAANYLESCAPDAVLFTYGDNDSFPLWYVQDVERLRTDVRVANLSYIQAGWYIDMMRQKAFDSDPLPLSLGSEKYLEGIRTQMPVNTTVNRPVNIKEVVRFLGLDDRKFQIDISGRGDYANYLPANQLLIDVDSASVVANGTVKEYYSDRIAAPMIWNYSDNNALKGDLAIMDLIASNNWERPVYYSTTVPSSQYKGLQKFFVQEGMAYRVVPVIIDETGEYDFGMIDPHVMYDNMMNKFKWGNAADPSVYLDENNRRMFSNFRRLFANLGRALLEAGDTTRAVEAVRRGYEIVPWSKLPDDYFCTGIAEVLINAGMKEEGLAILNRIKDYAVEHLDYLSSVKSVADYDLETETGINYQSLLDIYYMAEELDMPSLSETVEPLLNNYFSRFYQQTR